MTDNEIIALVVLGGVAWYLYLEYARRRYVPTDLTHGLPTAPLWATGVPDVPYWVQGIR